MSYRVVLSLDSVTGVTIKALPFDQLGSPRPGNPGSRDAAEFKIVGRVEAEEVEIVIANACDVNPLDWQAEHATPTREDIDFKWHYEILTTQKDEVKDELGEEPLPYPVIIGLGKGRNCYPAFWVE